jgi:hypothetical protein
MALGAMTHDATHSAEAYALARRSYLSFAGDGAYGAGGSAGFEALVRTALGKAVTVLSFEADLSVCGGYVVTYDKTNDKLKVFYCTNNGGAAGPLVEDVTANQSGRTYAGWVVWN